MSPISLIILVGLIISLFGYILSKFVKSSFVNLFEVERLVMTIVSFCYLIPVLSELNKILYTTTLFSFYIITIIITLVVMGLIIKEVLNRTLGLHEVLNSEELEAQLRADIEEIIELKYERPLFWLDIMEIVTSSALMIFTVVALF